MVTIGLYYEVKPEKQEIFEQKFREVQKVTDGMKGHKSSYLYRRVDDPDSYAVIGEWETREDFMVFVKSDLFRQVTRWGLEEVLKGKPRHKIYPRTDDLSNPSG